MVDRGCGEKVISARDVLRQTAAPCSYPIILSKVTAFYSALALHR